MLSLTLATFFIFYIAATNRSSSLPLVFCSKFVLRLLALVHYKYTENREIVVIRIRR